MRNLSIAVLMGTIAGAASIALYVSTTQHIVIFAPYVVLMTAVAAWMFHARIAAFWARAGVAVTALAMAALILSLYSIITYNEKVAVIGVVAGLGKALLLSSAASVVIAIVSGRKRDGGSIDLRYSSEAPR